MSIWGMRSWVWNMLEPNPLWVQEDTIRNHVLSFMFTAEDFNSRQHVRIFMRCLITSQSHSSHVSFFNMIVNMRTVGGWTANSMLNDSWCNICHQICTRNLNRKVVETVITSFKKFRIATRRTEAVVTVILSRDSNTLPPCSVQISRLSYSSTECLFCNSR
jgi:hypothetical protein